MDPAKFRAYLEAEVRKRAADLATAAPDTRPTREHSDDGTFKPTDQTGNDCPNGGMSDRKAKNLRAILRAPEIVQSLYRDGLIGQAVAAKMGPKAPTPEEAAKIAEARQGLDRLDRAMPHPPDMRKPTKGESTRVEIAPRPVFLTAQLP
jgi:hypothetical protein